MRRSGQAEGTRPAGAPRPQPVGLARLSALMFFQLFVFGSFGPILSMYLQDGLRLSSRQTGFIMAMSVVSSIMAPLLSAYVVDRLISAKRLFMLCHAVLAISSAGLFFARGFESFLALYLVNALCTGPSMGLLTAVTFQRLYDLEGSGRNYGGVRVWGTVGWMAAGYMLSGAWAGLAAAFPGIQPAAFQPSAFLLASLGSAMCIALALGLPSTGGVAHAPASGVGQAGAPAAASVVGPLAPRDGKETRSIGPAARREFLPREALRIVRRKGVGALAAVYLLSSIIDKLLSFGAAPYLASLGFRRSLIPSILTLGQATEVVMLFALGPLLARLGYRPALLLGALSQAARFLLLWTGAPALALMGITLNGIVFACLYSTILMYLDHQADAPSRQAIHQLVQLFFGGSAALVGNLLAGVLGTAAQAGSGFRGFWLVSMGGALVSAAVIALGFREERPRSYSRPA